MEQTTIERKLVSLDFLHNSGLNLRGKIAGKDVAGLADSIRSHGIIQPLVLRPMKNGTQLLEAYEVICGNRRWQAAKYAGLTHVPADIHTDMTDDQAREIILIENMQREDVHPLDEAEGLQELAKSYPDVRALATRIGKEPKWVRLIMQLHHLIPDGKKKFREGVFDLNIAIEIARLPHPEQQKDTLAWTVENWRGIPTVRELKEHIQKNYYLKLGNAPWDLGDELLSPSAGSCVKCPKRSGENPLLFPDIKEADTCTDPPCFQKKMAFHITGEQQRWKEKHPDQKLHQLSTTWNPKDDPKDTVHRGSFEIVTGARAKAPGVQKGIITLGTEKLGELVSFIPKQGQPADLSIQQRKNAYEERAKIREAQQRSAEDMEAIPYIMQQIRKNLGPITQTELVFLISDIVTRTSHDQLMRIAKTLSIVPPKADYVDYGAAVKERALKQVTDQRSFLCWLLEHQLCTHIGGLRNDNNPIHETAKKRQLDLNPLWVAIRKKFDDSRVRSQQRFGLTAAQLKEPEPKPKKEPERPIKVPSVKKTAVKKAAKKKGAK